jgi:hypothetical protein
LTNLRLPIRWIVRGGALKALLLSAVSAVAFPAAAAPSDWAGIDTTSSGMAATVRRHCPSHYERLGGTGSVEACAGEHLAARDRLAEIYPLLSSAAERALMIQEISVYQTSRHVVNWTGAEYWFGTRLRVRQSMEYGSGSGRCADRPLGSAIASC